MIRISSSSSAGSGKRLHEREPEDADPVGQGARPVAALGQGHALVEPEQVGIVRVLVLDRDLHVPDRLLQLRRQRGERPLDMRLESQ